MGDHKLKDAPGWKVLAHPDGSLTWISPCGRRRTTHPHDYRPFTDPMPEQADGTPDPDAPDPDPSDTTGALDAVAPDVAGSSPAADTGAGSQGTDQDAVPDDEPPF